MINNLNKIIPLLNFEEGTFYYLQVLQRKKDNPEMTQQTKQRYFKFIRSKKELDVFSKEAIEIADFYNARVYISLTPRSFEKLSLEALVELSTRIKNKDYNSNFKIFEKLALLPECAKKEGKLWMLDYDSFDEPEFVETYNIPVKALIPTISGYHIILEPFNLQVLGQPLYNDYNYDIDGYKFGLKFDCNTLLYYKKSNPYS